MCVLPVFLMKKLYQTTFLPHASGEAGARVIGRNFADWCLLF